MKNFLIFIIVVGALFYGGSFLMPARLDVQRTVVIDAPKDRVFSYVNDLKLWEKWSPWEEDDPTLEHTYSEKTTGVGATATWNGRKSDTGKIVITKSVENQQVSYDVYFDMPVVGGKGEGVFMLEQAEGGTQVLWSYSDEAGGNPIKRYAFKFFVQGMMEDALERGLQNLQDVTKTKS